MEISQWGAHFSRKFGVSPDREVADSEYLLHIDRNFLHEISGAVSLKLSTKQEGPFATQI